jgi:hypothetical protein
MTLATIQNLRTFNAGEHPTDLEPGQIAFNLSQENFDLANSNANIFMYVGNQSDLRLDEGGAVLVEGGTPGKGWVRYSLRNVRVDGDTVTGNLNVVGASINISRSASDYAELIVPKVSDTPTNGSYAGSVRWDNSTGKLQAWNGVKWDTTAKVTVSDTAPPNPSNGDMWLTVVPVPNFYVYVVPSSGPASWISATSGGGSTALQPGNGVTANSSNEIDIIDQGPF